MTRLPPDPDVLQPLPQAPGLVLLKPLLARTPEVTNVTAGSFSYYHDFDDGLGFLSRNVLYNYGISGARLRIGAYCAIAHGARFVMPDANHAMAGPSTFPFGILGGAFAAALPLDEYPWPPARDTVIGNDVWIGMEALVLPGVTIGDGAIIGAGAVVASDVPDYAVVAGNPAQVMRIRFDAATVARLKRLAWWDWPAERVARTVPALVKGDAAALEALAP
jgi:virginiamycin A acetyltransferase